MANPRRFILRSDWFGLSGDSAVVSQVGLNAVQRQIPCLGCRDTDA